MGAGIADYRSGMVGQISFFGNLSFHQKAFCELRFNVKSGAAEFPFSSVSFDPFDQKAEKVYILSSDKSSSDFIYS